MGGVYGKKCLNFVLKKYARVNIVRNHIARKMEMIVLRFIYISIFLQAYK